MDIERCFQAVNYRAKYINEARDADRTPDEGYGYELAEGYLNLVHLIRTTGELPKDLEGPVEERRRKTSVRAAPRRRPARKRVPEGQLELWSDVAALARSDLFRRVSHSAALGGEDERHLVRNGAPRAFPAAGRFA